MENSDKILAQVLEQNKILNELVTGLMKKKLPEPIDESKFPTKNDGFFKKIHTKDGLQWVPDYHGLACYMRDEFKVLSTDAFTYIHEDGFYQYAERGYLASIIDKLTLGKLKPTQINQFIQMIMAKTNQKNIALKSTDGFMNLKNGILNIKDKKLIGHSPHYFFKYKLPHSYNAESQCPRFMEFLDYIFEGNLDYIEATAEIFGYCILGGHPFLHKAIILYGEGRNGKSTWLDILKCLLGNQNVSAVSLANLIKPFSVVNLDGKLANITDETPSDQINAEVFKAATAGGCLTAAHKGKPEYEFNCNARFLFASNKMPHFNESTIGLKERLYFVRFERFIEESKRDSTFKTLIMNEEMSGIINFAIRGLDRLMLRNQLPQTAGNKETMDEFKLESDSVYEFFKSRLVVDVRAGEIVPLQTLYSSYDAYCRSSGRKSVSKNLFSRRIESHLKTELMQLGADNIKAIFRDSNDKMRIKRGFQGLYIRSGIDS